MRWFWLFILALVLLTAGLFTKRVRTNAVVAADPDGTAEQMNQTPRERKATPKQKVQRNEHREVEPDPEAEVRQESTNGYSPEDLMDFALNEPVPDLEPKPEPGSETDSIKTGFSVGTLFDSINLALSQSSDEALTQGRTPPTAFDTASTESSSEELVVESESGNDSDESERAQVESEPTYKLRSDGSFFVFATQSSVVGEGTSDLPFEVEWDTLRSVERDYNPKKGMDQLPDWLDLLDGKIVRITGNTLVPVIATTTRELLVMKNPWDGCCIGVPPSPYDAIEVTLNHDVDFGSSAVGYGTVQGVFILDPYVVDGWVLGLFLIEEATYRSGEGIAFPDF